MDEIARKRSLERSHPLNCVLEGLTVATDRSSRNQIAWNTEHESQSLCAENAATSGGSKPASKADVASPVTTHDAVSWFLWLYMYMSVNVLNNIGG